MFGAQNRVAEDLPVGEEFYFQWHITEKCNKVCKHCYQNGQLANDLPVEQLLKIVTLMEIACQKWSRKGVLSLTGGEPFIRRQDLFTLMDRIDASEYLAYYDILTNGSLISEEEAKNLTKQLHLRRVQISLEGATDKTNDRIRGAGSFASSISAIRHLRKAGIDVSVMTTLTKYNRDEIPALVDLLSAEGVLTLALERLIPEGAGAELSDQILSKEELQRVYETVHQIALKKPPVRILLYRPLFALLNANDHTVGALCSAGNNALTIMPDGTVYPCRRLPIPLGNVLTDGLFKIWYGSEVLWRLRNPQNLNSKCFNCDLLPKCRGCRAMAYSTTGDYMSEDPQCWK